MAKAKQIKGTPVVLVGLGSELLDQITNAAMVGVQDAVANAQVADLLSKLGFGEMLGVHAKAEAPKRSRRK
jgi:hypothetical protein